MGDNNPFSEQDPSQILNCPYTLTSTVGLKMQLYADQYEASGGAAQNQATQSGSKRTPGLGKQNLGQQSTS